MNQSSTARCNVFQGVEPLSHVQEERESRTVLPSRFPQILPNRAGHLLLGIYVWLLSFKQYIGFSISHLQQQRGKSCDQANALK